MCICLLLREDFKCDKGRANNNQVFSHAYTRRLRQHYLSAGGGSDGSVATARMIMSINCAMESSSLLRDVEGVEEAGGCVALTIDGVSSRRTRFKPLLSEVARSRFRLSLLRISRTDRYRLYISSALSLLSL